MGAKSAPMFPDARIDGLDFEGDNEIYMALEGACDVGTDAMLKLASVDVGLGPVDGPGAFDRLAARGVEVMRGGG